MLKYNNNNEVMAAYEQSFVSFCEALTKFVQNDFGFTEYNIINLETNKTIASNKKGELK